VGRVLRAVVDFEKLGENTIYLDCDVLQADGGTRTTAVNGSFVALIDAVNFAIEQELIQESPIKCAVAGVSVGIVQGRTVLDLDYELDSQAQVDMNVAMTDTGEFVELQGTAESGSFSNAQLEKMLQLAQRGIKQILKLQKESLKIK
jgi:ribonuclease PH